MARSRARFDQLLGSRADESPVNKIEDSPLLNAFARALSNALDESSERRVTGSRAKKNKNWKCQLKSKGGICLGKSIPKSSPKSDSESSLDSWIHQQMEIKRKVHNQCTDSDDVSKAYRHFADWRQCANNIGESDSVTESANRSREPRRKRKFKRMAIDPPAFGPPASTDREYLQMSCNSAFPQKNKRNRNQKSPRSSKVTIQCDKMTPTPLTRKVRDIHPNFPVAATACGKRKRCSDERSIEDILTDQHIFETNFSFKETYNHMEYGISSDSAEFSASEISSSESEWEVSTNDESREADDEQSDFFCEPGSSHSVLNSDDDEGDDDEEEEDETTGLCTLMEMRFDVIPAFRELYEIRRKQMYEALKKKIEENGHNVKSGQRRLLKAYRSTSAVNNELMPENSVNDEYQGFTRFVDNCLAKVSPSEKKKRKGMISPFNSSQDGKF